MSNMDKRWQAKHNLLHEADVVFAPYIFSDKYCPGSRHIIGKGEIPHYRKSWKENRAKVRCPVCKKKLDLYRTSRFNMLDGGYYIYYVPFHKPKKKTKKVTRKRVVNNRDYVRRWR